MFIRKYLAIAALLLAAIAHADVKISNLPAGTTLGGTEPIPAVQSGSTVRTTPAAIATYVFSNGTLTVAHGGTGATTLTGPLKGNGVGAISPAVAADITGLWSGTCNASSFLRGDGACAAGNAGTVTSVALTVPSGFSVTGSPITSSGTLAITGTLNVSAGGTGVGTLTGLALGNGTSAMSAYTGTSCTNQFPRSLSAAGGATCASVANADLSNSAITINGTSVSLGGTRTLSLGSADFVNQGTTTTLLHGNAAGNPSFGAASLTADVTGTLPVTNGGLGVATLTGLALGNGTSPVSAYAGTSCTNQFPRSLSAAGAATCASVANTDLTNSSITVNGTSVSLGGTRTLTLASADYANQGTTTTVLHGNGSGNPSFAAVNLAADVTGTLPSASVAAIGSTTQITYNNAGTMSGSANLTWDNTNSILSTSGLTASGATIYSALISPSTLASGTTNNYAPTSFSTSAVLRVTPNASGSDIGGIAGGAAGRHITIINISTSVSLGLLDQDSGSTAANRIMLPSGGRIDLPPAGSIQLWYDTTSSRWRTAAVTTVPTTVPGTHTFSGDISFTATPTSLEIFGVGVARSDFNLQGAIYHDTPLSPTGLASGSTNNYNPSGLGTTNIIRITPDVTSGSTLTGLTAQATGFTVTLFNIQTGATGTLTIAHQSASSTAANRIICPGETNLSVPAGDSVTLWYDITSTRWRVMR